MSKRISRTAGLDQLGPTRYCPGESLYFYLMHAKVRRHKITGTPWQRKVPRYRRSRRPITLAKVGM